MGLSDIAALQQLYAGKVQSPNLLKGSMSDASNPVTAPWVTMPDGGFPFNTPGTINTPAIAAGVWVDVINISVPSGFDGVIKRVVNRYNGQGFVDGSGTLIWRILRNSQAVRGYDSILSQLGDYGTGETQIRVGSGDLLQFQVQNVSLVSGGTQILCYFGGWYFPKKVV